MWGKNSKQTIQYSKLSFKELKTLSENGDAKAQKNLALCYEFGEGVRKSYKKAVEWFTKAANNNYAPAITNLAQIYWEDHNPIKEDAEKS